MREFFRGWKRKVGCVTLVLACVMMAFWVRSTSTIDNISTGVGSGRLHSQVRASFQSGPNLTQSLLSLRTKLPDDYRGGPFLNWSATSKDVGIHGFILDEKARWYWRGFGTQIGFQHLEWEFMADMFAVIVPHRMVVVSLTVISAWLLLSKPRAKSEPPTTPASENA